jgi:probable rRNA maturation factor
MRLGGGVREEVARLVIHGTLHILGHGHPDGDDRTTSRMWRRQEQLLSRVMHRGTVNGRAP